MSAIDDTDSDDSANRRVQALWGVGSLLFIVTIVLTGVLTWILSAPQSPAASSVVGVVRSVSANATQGAAQRSPLLTAVEIGVNGIGVFGSLSLSAVLAAIYLSQNDILSAQHSTQVTQNEIQETQSKIMESSYIPVLAADFRGVRLHDGQPSVGIEDDSQFTGECEQIITGEEEEQWMSVAVENHSEEIAQRVQLACLIEYSGFESEEEYTHAVVPIEVDGMRTELQTGEGALLPPTNGLSLLRAQPEFSTYVDDTKTFSTFLSTLRDLLVGDDGEERTAGYVRFGFILIFTNSVDRRFRLPLEDAYQLSPADFDDTDNVNISEIKENKERCGINELKNNTDWEMPEEAF